MFPRAGTPLLKEKVLEATRAHQQSREAEDFALAYAYILEEVLTGSTIAAALDRAPGLLPDATLKAFAAARAIKSADKITSVCTPCGLGT